MKVVKNINKVRECQLLKRQTYGETVTERLQHVGRTFERQVDLFGAW